MTDIFTVFCQIILGISLLYLVKDRVVALSDAGPLRLPSYRYLDNRLDVYARQLSALDDPHTNLEQEDI